MPARLIRSILLLGSSLATWAPLRAATATVDAAVPASASPPVADDRETVTVTGSRPATVAAAATKGDLPVAETPQSISVISSADISALGLQNLNQALRFVPGVTPEQRGASAEVYDQFKLRGFDAPVFLDGLRTFSSASGYAATQIDVSRLDRIEIIKGPSSALYGQTGPGGLVAEQSKLPLDQAFYGAVSGTYGNYDLYRVDADVGGHAKSDILWRLYGSANGSHDQQTYGVRRRQTVSGAVTLGANTDTSMTVLLNYSHDPRNGNYGVFPAVGTFFDNPAGKISTHFYGGEPSDFFKRQQFGATYIFDHDFGHDWHFKALGRYQYVSSSLGIYYTGGFPVDVTQAAPTLFTRYSYSTAEKNNNWTYDNQLTGLVHTGPFEHHILLGVDRQVAHSNEDYAFGSGTAIDVFNPVYGTAPAIRRLADVPDAFGGTARTQLRQQGIYGQDEITAGGLRLLVSGRQDWTRQASNTVADAQHNNKFTYRAAVLYKTAIGLAPYVSYATSFEPVAGNILNPDGSIGVPKPTQGRQVEAGVKYQVPNTAILLTGAWFRITQNNLLQGSNTPGFSIQTGRVRSTGVELEATAPLPYGFNAKVAFSRQHVRSVDGDNGAQLLGVGRGGTSANLEWAPKAGPLEGLVVGGDVRHVNSITAGTYNDGVTYLGDVAYRTPSYTLFDAQLRYDMGRLSTRFERVTLGLNATNLFDKKYLSTCYLTYGWCWYGNRRTVQGTVGYRW